MIEELSKNDTNWRKIAFQICKDKDLANDIVNDMYIKMHDKCNRTYKEISIPYVWAVMKNIHLGYIKRRLKEIPLELFFNNIEGVASNYMGSVRHDLTVLDDRIEINNAISDLELWDREILLHTSETSLRKLSKETQIPTHVLHYSKKIALQKLKDKL